MYRYNIQVYHISKIMRIKKPVLILTQLVSLESEECIIIISLDNICYLLHDLNIIWRVRVCVTI